MSVNMTKDMFEPPKGIRTGNLSGSQMRGRFHEMWKLHPLYNIDNKSKSKKSETTKPKG